MNEESKNIYWASITMSGMIAFVLSAVVFVSESSELSTAQRFSLAILIVGSVAGGVEFHKLLDEKVYKKGKDLNRILLIVAGVVAAPVGSVLFICHLFINIFRWLTGRPK